MTGPTKDWLIGQITLPNIVIVATAAVGIGGYIRSFEALEARVVAGEVQHRLDMAWIAETYQRKDVQSTEWQYVREQLAEIKRKLETLEAQRR